MLFTSWLRSLRSASPSGRVERNRHRSPAISATTRYRPRLELLEDRTLLSAVSFSAPANYAAGDGPYAVAVGDFNGDGRPDLAVANSNDQTVSVLLGKGDGTFQTAQNFATGGGGIPVSVAVGDFNGDGKLDLAVANELGHTVSVLLGNGDGTLQTARNFATGSDAASVAVGDFNSDGKLDLAVGHGYGNVSVLVGNGDGTFQTARNFATGGDSASVAVGDFNGDGKLDLAVGHVFSGNVSVLLGNGDDTFQTAQNFTAGLYPDSVAVRDFNGDGKLDLAVANRGSGSGNVSVLLGTGDGSFQTAQNFAAGYFTQSVAVGDFNGDGKPDLAVTDLAVNIYDVSVLLNQFVTTTVVSGPTSSTYGQSVTYTATVMSGATPVTAGTVTFLDGNTPLTGALAVNSNGQASFSIATLNAGSYTITASYSGTPGGARTTGFGSSTGSAGLAVNPAPLTATGVNFNATAGAPFSGAVATFTNADPFGSTASYTAVITWGDGSTAAGIITGTGTLTVSGAYTYADPGSYPLSVQISHNLGNTTTATVYPTANVTSLGQAVHGLMGGIGLWHNKNGQALINGFNGGANATALSTWLATSFANLYGAGAGANDLTGQSNYQVALFYQNQFALSGSKLEAQVLTTALNVYATTLSLGGTIGQAYGFTVSADGLGADSFNVGADGAAFGVANNTTLNVYELLKAVDRQAVNGVLYNGDKTLRGEANDLFDALIKAGAIS